ncbi:MAG: helix-turn-helix transcriptional regulator [Alphaproteobacteria bacterium]|nr:helix-turn-helix transcriptional regulator [Alphaproteobacteria bacterium]
MGALSHIEDMARAGAIALLLLWLVVLLRRHRDQRGALGVAAFVVTVICHLLAIVPGLEVGNVAVDVVVEIGSGIAAPVFWLMARLWFDDGERPLTRALTLVALGAIPPAIFAFQRVGLVEVPVALLGPVWRLETFLFAGAGLWIAWRGRDDDLVEGRRRLRVAMIWSVGLYVLLVNGVEIAIFQFGAPYGLRSLLVVGIAALTFALVAATLGVRDADLFGAPQRRAPERVRAEDAESDALAARLDGLMAADKPWRDETLTVAALAARLGVPEYRLRRLINGHLGHRNFAAYLNGFRLDEVEAALADPAQREVPILTIALDAGFGSLAPFNRAFRDRHGETPSEYRQKRLIDSGNA